MHLNPINLSAARLALIERSTQSGPTGSLCLGMGPGLLSDPGRVCHGRAGPTPAAEAAQVKAPGRKVEGGGASGGHMETCSNPGPG